MCLKLINSLFGIYELAKKIHLLGDKSHDTSVQTLLAQNAFQRNQVIEDFLEQFV